MFKLLPRSCAVVVTALFLLGALPLAQAENPAIAGLRSCTSEEAKQHSLFDCTVIVIGAREVENLVKDSLEGRGVSTAIFGAPYTLHMMVNPIFAPEVLESTPHIVPLAGVAEEITNGFVRLTADLQQGTLQGIFQVDALTVVLQPLGGIGPNHVLYTPESSDLKAWREGALEDIARDPNADVPDWTHVGPIVHPDVLELELLDPTSLTALGGLGDELMPLPVPDALAYYEDAVSPAVGLVSGLLDGSQEPASTPAPHSSSTMSTTGAPSPPGRYDPDDSNGDGIPDQDGPVEAVTDWYYERYHRPRGEPWQPAWQQPGHREVSVSRPTLQGNVSDTELVRPISMPSTPFDASAAVIHQPKCTGCTTLTNLWVTAYYDQADPTYIFNVLDPYLQVEGFRIYMPVKILFDLTGLVADCNPGPTDIAHWLGDNRILPNPVPPTGSDRIHFFVSNPPGGFGAAGCADAIPSKHSWSGFDVANDYDRMMKAMHELGHTFGASHIETAMSTANHATSIPAQAGTFTGAPPHATGCAGHTHTYYSVMSAGDDNTCTRTKQPAYIAATDTAIQAEKDAMPRFLTYFYGTFADGNHAGLNLIYWHMTYFKDIHGGAPSGTLQLYKDMKMTAGTLTVKHFYGARTCATTLASCAGTDPSADFAQYTQRTIGTTDDIVFNTYNIPSTTTAKQWEIWPAFCHLHSTACSHYGPLEWKSIVLRVNP